MPRPFIVVVIAAAANATKLETKAEDYDMDFWINRYKVDDDRHHYLEPNYDHEKDYYHEKDYLGDYGHQHEHSFQPYKPHYHHDDENHSYEDTIELEPDQNEGPIAPEQEQEPTEPYVIPGP